MLSSPPDFPISWSLGLASSDNMNSIHEDTWELREMDEYAQGDRGDWDAFSVSRSVDAHLHKLHVSMSQKTWLGTEAHIQ